MIVETGSRLWAHPASLRLISILPAGPGVHPIPAYKRAHHIVLGSFQNNTISNSFEFVCVFKLKSSGQLLDNLKKSVK